MLNGWNENVWTTKCESYIFGRVFSTACELTVSIPAAIVVTNSRSYFLIQASFLVLPTLNGLLFHCCEHKDRIWTQLLKERSFYSRYAVRGGRSSHYVRVPFYDFFFCQKYSTNKAVDKKGVSWSIWTAMLLLIITLLGRISRQSGLGVLSFLSINMVLEFFGTKWVAFRPMCNWYSVEECLSDIRDWIQFLHQKALDCAHWHNAYVRGRVQLLYLFSAYNVVWYTCCKSILIDLTNF